MSDKPEGKPRTSASSDRPASQTKEGPVPAEAGSAYRNDRTEKEKAALRKDAKKSDPDNVVTDNIVEGAEADSPSFDEESAPADPFKVPKELPATHLVEEDDPAPKGKAGPKGIEVENVGPVMKSPELFRDDAQKFPEREENDQDYKNPSLPRLASDREMLEAALEMKDVDYPGKNKGPQEAPMPRPLPEDSLAKKQMQDNVPRQLAEDRDFEKRDAEAALGEQLHEDDEQPYQRPLAEDRERWKARRGTLEKERGPEPR